MKWFKVVMRRIGVFISIVGTLFAANKGFGGDQARKFSITKLAYQINSGKTLWAKGDTIIAFSSEDKLSLVELTFKSSISNGSVWAEAYLHDGKIIGEKGWAYTNGQFTYGKSLASGQNILTFKPGSWTLKPTHDRIVVVLIHQYGADDRDFRKVDKIYINLRREEPKK